MLDSVKGVQKLHESSPICEESLHNKFETPSTFPSCLKVCGGCLVLKVDFSVKIETHA